MRNGFLVILAWLGVFALAILFAMEKGKAVARFRTLEQKVAVLEGRAKALRESVDRLEAAAPKPSEGAAKPAPRPSPPLGP